MACGTSWLIYLHRYVFALIKPKLSAEWDLKKDELGLLDSAFSVFYTGMQVPLGIAADVWGVHLVLTGLIVVGSIGLAMHAWAPSTTMLWAARAALGIGQSAVFAAQSRISRTWFPPSVRTTVQGWLGVFFSRIGGLSANVLVGTLMLGVFGFPWRTAVLAMAGLGLLHGLVFALLFRNSPRRHPSVNEAEAALIEGDGLSPSASRAARPAGLRELIRRMTPRSIANLLALNVQTILSTLADNIYSAWIPMFLVEVYQVTDTRMGIFAALPLLGGALGGAMGGWLNDRLILRTGNRRWARSAVGLAGKGMAGLLLLAALLVYDSPTLFSVSLFFVKFFSDWSLTTTWGVVTDIGGRASATVFALNNTVAGVGSILGPVLYGSVAEYYGWIPVFLTAAATYFACAATWLLINCAIPIIAEENTEIVPR
jgi:ACS family glucarate transporter-like MFS transporter